MYFVIVGALIGLASFSLAATSGAQVKSDLQPRLSPQSSFYFPTDPDWANETTQRWNTYMPPTYFVSIKPALETDVQTIINYAHQKNIPFLATGGGHGYSDSLSTLQNGIEMDLSNFQQISINSQANTMTIGGAVRFRDVIDALQAAGKEVPVGDCSCIGMMGALLGGGVGPLAGKYGLIMDQVISFRMVTGSGEILTVSQVENPDLFWGMKGAGFNYGTVTSALLRIYDATNGGYLVNADMIFPSALNESVWNIVKNLSHNQDKLLTLNPAVAYNASLGELALIFNAAYFGTVQQAETILKPLLDLKPFNLNISSIQYKDLPNSAVYGAIEAGCAPQPAVAYAVNLFDVNVPNLVNVTDFMAQTLPTNPALQGSILTIESISPYGPALYPDASSAYPYRNTAVYASLDGFLPIPSQAAAVDAWATQIRSMLAAGAPAPPSEGVPSGTIPVYINFAHGDEGPAGWYSERNLPALRALKLRFDPFRLFSYYGDVGQY